jgi:hypothetical protein
MSPETPCEVVRGDLKAGVEVETMRIGAVCSDAGVEVKLLAPEPASLLYQPLEQAPTMPLAARFRKGREVVDVEEVSPGKHVPDTKAGHRSRMRPLRLEDADEPVPLGALNVVDETDELRLVR